MHPSQGSIVGIVTRLRARAWGWNPRRDKIFYSSLKHSDQLTQSTIQRDRTSLQRVKQSTTHLHLVLRLRLSGDMPLLCLYACMAWTRKTTLFYFPFLH